MAKATRDFQVFAKPIGAICNLDCQYCYYLKKESLYPEGESFRMPHDILEAFIVQQIEACSDPVIRFSWHGGEPTVLGLDYFREIVALQRRHQPPNQGIVNCLQTNGTLLDEDWCRFLAAEGFGVGLSLDGPQELHDRYRLTKGQKPTFEEVMRGYRLLRRHQITCDILCVVNAHNVQHPIQVYRFFKQIEAAYVGFLPLVEQVGNGDVSSRTVPTRAWGSFLCDIFDEWVARDVGKIKVQIFEEAARTAFEQDHSLCIFRETCGDFPVVEHNGDFFSCDHYVDPEHRVGNVCEASLVELLESPAQRAFGQIKQKGLPRCCRKCAVRTMCNGGCPKNRFLRSPDGQSGLNYLCEGYKRFFTHCRPFVEELAAMWRRRSSKAQPEGTQTSQVGMTAGRNDPCPCGSGRKYKKCCLGKA